MDAKKLMQMPLFAHCREEDVIRFMTCVNPQCRSFPKETVIHKAGEAPDGIYVVLQGHLALVRTSINGNESIIDELTSGDLYGQLIAFTEEKPKDLYLQALSDAKCLVFPGTAFYQTCSATCPSHQQVIRNMLSLVSSQAARLMDKVNVLSSPSLKGKIARLLLSEAQHHPAGAVFTLEHNREALAQALGIARPSLSRALAQLQADGIIDYDRQAFRIIDPEALAALE